MIYENDEKINTIYEMSNKHYNGKCECKDKKKNCFHSFKDEDMNLDIKRFCIDKEYNRKHIHKFLICYNIGMSTSQSLKSKAGKKFENDFEKILIDNGFVKGENYDREVCVHSGILYKNIPKGGLRGGHRVDFIIPAIKQDTRLSDFKGEIISCKTVLRERHLQDKFLGDKLTLISHEKCRDPDIRSIKISDETELNNWIEAIKLKINLHNSTTIISMNDTYRNEISFNGYKLDVLKSGLQKYIRRGMIDKALYCAGELDLFKDCLNRGETIRTNFLHRLMIIFLEDIENVNIINDIDKEIRFLFSEKKKTEGRDKAKEEKSIEKIVKLLCLSEKARLTSHLRAVFSDTFKPLHDKYPSIKKMWRDIEEKDDLEHNMNMFKKSVKNKSIVSIYYAFKISSSKEKLSKKINRSNNPVWFIFDQLKKSVYVEWYKLLKNTKESFLCWLLPLIYELDLIKGSDVNIDNESRGWEDNRAGIKIDFEDFVIDRHTRVGNRSMVDFAVIGAYVSNESKYVNDVWKRFYEDSKRFVENKEVLGEDFEKLRLIKNISNKTGRHKSFYNDWSIEELKERCESISLPKETEEFKFIVRTQLTTSHSKMDVYFAKDKKDKLVIVKGPFKDKKDVDILSSNNEWKEKNGLKYIPFELRELIPDRWEEGVPLGNRNNIDRTKLAYFLVFESVVKEEDIERKIHSSKLWPETEVVDWKKVSLHFHIERKLSDIEYKDYLEAVLYRYVRGIPDLADRNFLMVDGRVISIDEELVGKEINLYSELKKNKCAILYKWLNKNYESLNLDWKVDNEKELSRLKIVKDKTECLNLFRCE